MSRKRRRVSSGWWLWLAAAAAIYLAVEYGSAALMKDANPLVASLLGGSLGALRGVLPWICGACVVFAVISLMRTLWARWQAGREPRADKVLEQLSAAAAPGKSQVTRPEQPAPSCPLCDGAMSLRTATQGEFAGKRFWGCQRFPECDGRKEIEERA